jgi:hypothetical protein
MSSWTSTKSLARWAATMPDANFSSMKRGIGNRAKRSPRSATVAGSGKAMGLRLQVLVAHHEIHAHAGVARPAD